MGVGIVILAAGEGTRMKSSLSKVLHPLCGQPMIKYVVDTARKINPEKIIMVVGHKADQVKDVVGSKVDFVVQERQLGTGHAVKVTENVLTDLKGDLLILNGDTPLITFITLKNLINLHNKNKSSITLLTTYFDNPYGYGRIVRNKNGLVEKIIEEKDATENEKQICEVNTGIYCFKKDKLFNSLKKIKANNRQKEYYLTDVVEILKNENQVISAFLTNNSDEVLGINSRIQLAEANGLMKKEINDYWMKEGVSIIDPQSTFIDKNVKIGRDTVIYPFCFLEGKTTIGKGCSVGPLAHLIDTKIGNNVKIQYAVVKECNIKGDNVIGPFCSLRPGTIMEKEAKAGTFVEIKNTRIKEKSKVPHLSYIGDAVIGKEVNVGAGTITCNYDGANKHKTIIEDGAFIGSDTMLIAPVKIGKKAITGAGSAIAKNVPAGSLGLERCEQKNISGYRERLTKKRKDYIFIFKCANISIDLNTSEVERETSMINVTKKRMMLFSGTSNLQLSSEIAGIFGLELGKVEISTFKNGEIYVRFLESVRGADVFVVQSICPPVNSNLMELLIMIDALKRASAKRISAVVPHYGYARQDKKTLSREPITAKLIADLFSTAGADRILTMDLHAGQIQGFFDIPVDHITAIPTLASYFAKKDLKDIVVVSPDVGRVKTAKKFADMVGGSLAILHKLRPAHNISETTRDIIGEVEGKNAIIIDDMIDTGGTILEGAEVLLSKGAKDIYACATHPILSGSAVERFKASPLREIVLTNTIPIPKEKLIDKFTVLSIAPLLTDAIRSVYEDESVSEKFGGDNQP
ncbi:MAG: bifunctional UDP-N-acetylglucosamine diphosphorylase/glucosamine-1-phosphate N-acetyltransferase GlmU [Actinobacteria bacterium]|nr:bifunctional UDP-N-acetylglucosamine diphosphorylase/glucosamine-1-phosphate N-acetyltransferase GlmU [Actinomycetota bacterium]